MARYSTHRCKRVLTSESRPHTHDGTSLHTYTIGVYRFPNTNSPTLDLPAECDVDGQFVDLSLVRQAFVAGVGQKGQPFIVRDNGVAEARSATLQSDKCLWYTVTG